MKITTRDVCTRALSIPEALSARTFTTPLGRSFVSSAPPCTRHHARVRQTYFYNIISCVLRVGVMCFLGARPPVLMGVSSSRQRAKQEIHGVWHGVERFAQGHALNINELYRYDTGRLDRQQGGRDYVVRQPRCKLYSISQQTRGCA